MKRLLIASLFITALSQEIDEMCTEMPDQPVKICLDDDILWQILPTNPISILSLNLAGIQSVKANTFKDLQLEELDLYSDADFTELDVSSGAFNNVGVTTLVVENISLTGETNPFAALKSVKSLTWWSNSLLNFSGAFFADFPRLESLTIGMYEGKNAYPISFSKANKGLGRLKLVDAIVSIYPDTLSQLTNLIDLHIETANIGHLREDVFSSLQSLVYLILTNCGITSIEENTFHGLPLKILDLSNNWISNIAPKIFLNVPLNTIILSGNYLQEISSEVFNSTRDVEYISLGKNEITSIGAEIFQNLKQLYLLDLSNNQINHIAPDAFFGSVMSICNLQNNSIEVLPRDVFQGLALKFSLNLGGNNITRIESGALKTILSVSSYGRILLILANSSKFSGELPDNWVVRDSL